jgi:hypothetical protein
MRTLLGLKFSVTTFNNTNKLLTGFLALILVAGMTSPAFAGIPPVPPMCENTMPPIGASESIGPSPTQQDVFYCDEDPATWYIGSDPLPQVVIADPNAGPWIKNLQPPLFGPDLEPLILEGFYPGFRDTLIERIQVGPGLAWTDWHEQIFSPGFSFESVFVEVINPDGTPNPNFIIAPSDPFSVWIDFVPPLEPGSILIIEKNIFYDGPPTDEPLQIEEWPTFEEENRPIGGTVGSMSTTSLLVAGAQANMGLWSLALVGIVGAAAAITYKVKSKSEQ